MVLLYFSFVCFQVVFFELLQYMLTQCNGFYLESTFPTTGVQIFVLRLAVKLSKANVMLLKTIIIIIIIIIIFTFIS